jgi:PAS domain S-box-containing protein
VLDPSRDPKFAESLIETARAIVLVLDPQGRIVRFNPYMETVSGYTLQEVQGKDWFHTFLPSSDQGAIKDIFSKAIHDHKTKGNINPIVTKDGTLCFIEWYDTTLKDANGQITGLLSIGQDVTERLAIERNLGIKDAAVDSTHNAVAFADLEGNLTYVNPAFLALWGYDRAEELYGKHATNYWHEASEAARVISALGESGHWKGELVAVRQDGTTFPADVSASMVIGKDGQPLGLVSIFEDISERKQAERVLIEAKEQAEQANQAKSLFLSRMSHELRTPLNSILGFAQLLDADLNEEHKQKLKYILSSGQHLLDLINDLLDLSRIEHNKLEVVLERVDLEGRIQDSIEAIKPLAAERNIEIHCDLRQFHNRFVQADAVRLKQVLLNLLSNAVKYNQSPGRVTIAGEAVSSSRIRISISDTGLGVAREDFPVLFEPFNRLYLKTYATEGSGIGLALAKQLVELMGGDIGVQSELGQGSTFWIELSQVPDKPVGNPFTAELEPGIADSAFTLLYVEDSPSHIKLVEAIFAREDDIKLYTANTPRLGLEMVRTCNPDLILLDICLPGMDGYQVFSHLSEHESTRHIPVIALSAGAMPHEIEKALRSGFRRYLTKPVDIGELLRAVKEVLQDGSAAVLRN